MTDRRAKSGGDSRDRRVLASLAALVALAGTLAAGELLVRLATRYNTPDTVRRATLQYVPSALARHALAPGQQVYPDRGWGSPPQGGGRDRVYRINDLGTRGRDVSRDKPPGTCRLLVIGGSAVFDVGASEGEDWPHRLEAQLRDDGYRVEVINAGVPGHATPDAIGRLYGELWQLDPDVVLTYHGWNDLKAFRELTGGQTLLRSTRPYDPRSDPFQHYRGPLDRLLSHSQLYLKLRNRYWIWKLDPGPEGRIPDRNRQADYPPLAVSQVRLATEVLTATVLSLHAAPVLVTQARLVAPDNRPEERARIAYAYVGLTHDALVRAFEDLDRSLREVAADRGALLIDAAGPLSGRPELFEDHVHTSRAGSIALAGLVADELAPHLATLCDPASPLRRPSGGRRGGTRR